MKNLNACLDRYFEQNKLHNIAIRVGRGDEILCDVYRSAESDIDQHTLFDMASVTKIIATTSLAFIAIDRGLISLDDKVSKFFDCPADKQELRIFNLLTHTIGIGHKPLNLPSVNYDNVADYILTLPLDIPIGSDVLYSCPGYIILGKILEKVFGKRLDLLFKELVAEPLGMSRSSFLPDKSRQIVNSNSEEALRGVVNDYNCQHLGGVAGNAGLFSCIEDVTKYAKMLLNMGAPLFSKPILEKAVQNHTPGASQARGLGFVYVDDRYEQTDDLFEVGAIGHGGHTGQSVFVDVRSGLYAIVLSDCTISVIKAFPDIDHYYYEDVKVMRRDVHKALMQDLF